MGVVDWLRGRGIPDLPLDEDDHAALPGPGADAVLLLSTYEATWDDVDAGIAAALDALPGGDLVMTRGEYYRWIQDARAWAMSGLRHTDRRGDPYREPLIVDEALRRAARAVLAALKEDSPRAAVEALAGYVGALRVSQRP